MQRTSVGIANLPNQRYRHLNHQGATLTLMVVGESGLGKTTFINTLFSTNLKAKADDHERFEQPVRKTVEIDITRAEIEEKGFNLRVNVIDTPGFGDNVDNNAAWYPITSFLDDQHEIFMSQDAQPDRSRIQDLRVNACLYFIRPTGHQLKPLDIEAIRALSQRVNVIPVIAKADTLDAEEMALFKERTRDILNANGISVYVPADLSTGKPFADQLPYSVIGAGDREVPNVRGELVRGRQYLWGVAEVENEQHCDFKKLRNLLIRTHMLDLIHSTHENHYAAYHKNNRSAKQAGQNRENRKSLNPRYKDEETQLRKAFTDQVNLEVERFNKWEANLIAERDRLNKDLEAKHSSNKSLLQTVENMALQLRQP